MVECSSCKKQIVDSKDINVVALLGIKIKSLCNTCYSSRARGILQTTLYYPKGFPLNSILFSILLTIGTLILLFVMYVILFNNAQTIMVNGLPVFFSYEYRIALTGIIFIVLIWQWHLWTTARKIVKSIQ